jgi:hypothetical protein
MFVFFAGLFAGVLAAGSIWFWLVLIAIGVGLVALVENEKGTWATITTIGTILLLNYAWKVPIFKSMIAHPWAVLGWIGVYYACGVVWGILKWTSFVHKKVGAYNEYKAKFLADNKATALTPELAAKLADRLDNPRYDSKDVTAIAPTASEHKSDILRWMTYWPFSIVGTLLSDIVLKLWNHIYTFLATTYDRIAARLYKGVTADMALAEQYHKDQEALAKQQLDDVQPARRK